MRKQMIPGVLADFLGAQPCDLDSMPDYILDNIGNRNIVTNPTETIVYGVNSLNQYTNIANGVTNSPTYDLDGNMLYDGTWTYSWNGENRLISASNGATVVSFSYDYMGRRYSKTTNSVTTTFVYDGWNMIQESSSVETNHYVWGLDLSGNMEDAGGVGGLLSITEDDGSVYFPVADANGNVAGYIDDSGNVEAVYTYNAFGGILASSGVKKNDFKFRFSSKYEDETGLNYYGLRYYDAEMGRWLNRDPIEERGGNNLYVFLYNSTPHSVDALGLIRLPDLPGRILSPSVSASIQAASSSFDGKYTYECYTFKANRPVITMLNTHAVGFSCGWPSLYKNRVMSEANSAIDSAGPYPKEIEIGCPTCETCNIEATAAIAVDVSLSGKLLSVHFGCDLLFRMTIGITGRISGGSCL